MSLRLFVATTTTMVALAVLPHSGILRAQQSQAQPRDPRPDVARPASARELTLQATLAKDPANVANWLELAKLQEARGATGEAEAALKTAVARSSGSREALMSLAQFYNRTGQFEQTMSVLEDVAAKSPTDPAAHQLVATYYWEKAQRDATLSPEDKARHIGAGITATDRALAIKPDYVEAMVYKNILLRMQAALPSEAGRKDVLIAEADALRNRSIELQKANNKARVSISEDLQPQYPPPPSTPASSEVNGLAPVRVGGNIKTPTKIKDMRPVYPQDAMDAGVSGMVIIEAVIDTSGSVHSARVLRSIPALDRAALEAVQQWRFTPTLLDGVPVPVAMTVTVNFTLQ